MAKRPPEPRPPSPPPGFSPDPSSASVSCFNDDPAFLQSVSGTIRNEWVRLRMEFVERGLLPPEEGQVINEEWLDELMAALRAGKQIPGYLLQTDRTCAMFWQDLACFARWYAQLSASQRQEIREGLADGVLYPWLSDDEMGYPPAFDPCMDHMTPDQKVSCCPDRVWADPTYHTGSPPTFGPKKTNWTLYGALGAMALVIGVGAVAWQSAGQAQYSEIPT